MSPVLRSYIVGGALLAAGVSGLGYLTSYLGAKHVDQIISDKMAARAPAEEMAARIFEGLRQGNALMSLVDLEALADQGHPRSSALLSWIYDSRAMVKERDDLVMHSLDRMVDPDLLLFLGFVARTFDEQARDEAYAKMMDSGKKVSLSAIYASMQTDLSEGDLARLKSCYARLQKIYSDDPHGRSAIRYAYFSDTMSCQTNQGLHDADQTGT